jgi:hypothetical protein
MWRCTFGTAPRDSSVESHEWVDIFDRNVRANRETFPWRSPAETATPPPPPPPPPFSHEYERNLNKNEKKKKESYWRSV